MEYCPHWCAVAHTDPTSIGHHERTLLEREDQHGRLIVVMDVPHPPTPQVNLTVDMMLVDLSTDGVRQLAASLIECAHVAEATHVSPYSQSPYAADPTYPADPIYPPAPTYPYEPPADPLGPALY